MLLWTDIKTDCLILFSLTAKHYFGNLLLHVSLHLLPHEITWDHVRWCNAPSGTLVLIIFCRVWSAIIFKSCRLCLSEIIEKREVCPYVHPCVWFQKSVRILKLLYWPLPITKNCLLTIKWQIIHKYPLHSSTSLHKIVVALPVCKAAFFSLRPIPDIRIIFISMETNPTECLETAWTL